jgi:hypothetical protein
MKKLKKMLLNNFDLKENIHDRITFSSCYYKYIYSSDAPGVGEKKSRISTWGREGEKRSKKCFDGGSD